MPLTGRLAPLRRSTSSAPRTRRTERLGLDVGPMVDRVSWLVDRILGDHRSTGRAKREWLCETLRLRAAEPGRHG
jgi:hypothetical protein